MADTLMAVEHKDPKNLVVNTGQGWWNESDCAQTIRTPCGGDAVKANLVVDITHCDSVVRVYEESTPALQARMGTGGNQVPICLQGNGIDRADTAGCNGKGWCDDGVAYTLNTVDRQAVATIDGRNGVLNEELSGTLQAKPGGGFSYNCVNPVIMATGQTNAEITEDLSPTLNAGHEQPILARKYTVRRLTPLECCRLQGFPDGWEDGANGSDTARYKMWGNGIALPCAEYVMEGIAEELRKEETE